jgi:drug/metabolite transporter (DMT)-like permease
MDTANEHRGRGLAAIAASAFLWSLAGVFIKLIPWSPTLIAGLRSLIASLVLLVWLKKPRFHGSFAQVTAAVLNSITMSLFIYANKSTTAANAILLQYSAPVITAIAGMIILKEKPRIEQIAAFVFVMIGMGVFFMDGLGGGSLLGNIAAALSGLTFGLYFVFMRMQKDGSAMESILLSHWITAGIMLPLSLLSPLPRFAAVPIGAILGLGLLQIGLASIFFAYGIKRVTAVQAVLVALIEPAFNPLWVFLVMSEMPARNSIAGGLIILTAVTAASAVSARRAAT